MYDDVMGARVSGIKVEESKLDQFSENDTVKAYGE